MRARSVVGSMLTRLTADSLSRLYELYERELCWAPLGRRHDSVFHQQARPLHERASTVGMSGGAAWSNAPVPEASSPMAVIPANRACVWSGSHSHQPRVDDRAQCGMSGKSVDLR